MSQSGPLPQELLQPPDEPADQAAPLDLPELAPPAPVAYDPNAVTYRMEAWMPDTIASYKLRGFVHDHEGEVIESVPGRIRVRLGGKPGSDPSGLGWLMGF